MSPRLRGRVSHLRGISESEDGFTLIEVLVSIVLFVIVAASASVAVANGIKTSRTTQDRVTATNLAQQQIELIRGSQLPAATTSTATVGNKTFTISRQVSTPTPAGATTPSCYPGGTRQVTIVVTAPGSGRTVRMDTVVAC